jgi:hypothetical protein
MFDKIAKGRANVNAGRDGNTFLNPQWVTRFAVCAKQAPRSLDLLVIRIPSPHHPARLQRRYLAHIKTA